MNTHQMVINGARANNLKGFSLAIPHHQLIVVTGVSGSGKSSLAFDIIAREGQRRYFETLPSFARQFMGKLSQPDVDSIDGLSPVIAIGQKTTGVHARSTVGTMSDLYDVLRLLFARTGNAPEHVQLSRSLFSFNTETGQCPRCKGIGKEEKIDLQKLVTDPQKTLREGALAPTLPTGYIMYSQVTIDVLNQVCEAEGFNVDIPWAELTDAQRDVILYGSEKIKVPFGKHSLESRLKWTGIKAKPREEGYYKGMLTIMSDILRRDRNANILKYVSAVTCGECNGNRLNKDALSVSVQGKSIAEVSGMTIGELHKWVQEHQWNEAASTILDKITEKTALLQDLGLGHISLQLPAVDLSASEAQRIRVANQLTAPLSDVLYVLDEPSIGLHPEENQRMIHHLKKLVEKGNTVIVVEHDLDTIRHADWIIDIGPKAGKDGGKLLFNGTLNAFLKETTLQEISPTYRSLKQSDTIVHEAAPERGVLQLKQCSKGVLKHVDVAFQLGQINTISGKSGSGTRDLFQTLQALAENQLNGQGTVWDVVEDVVNIEAIDQYVFVDQSPIGRTPRSNPATYLGISDAIRDLFAGLPESKKRGYTKSRFSFNNKGGRCETCQGAGKTQIGMHFLGNVDIVCGTCGGDRFNAETLEVLYQEKSIAEVYQLSVNEALAFFVQNNSTAEKKLRRGLQTLQDIGLGYLALGQSSTTLSGGEAQRIKIANQLQKKDSGNTLYLIVEPSIGLHNSDLQSLIKMFDHLTARGNTVVCIEQDEHVIQASDWHIEMGIQDKQGGYVLHEGAPKPSVFNNKKQSSEASEDRVHESTQIILKGVTTNTLKDIDVHIPKQQLTVVTGRSGSGKSSLVYDTLFAEANARFSESLSTYNRTFLQQNSTAELKAYEGMTPAIALRRRSGAVSKSSTVGTLSGIYDHLRLLYARIAAEHGEKVTAQHYSFNHHLGACETCNGEGVLMQCDPDKLLADVDSSVLDGAWVNNKALNYYSNPDGQFIATLKAVAEFNGWNLEQPWSSLTDEQQEVVLYGTGERQWEVTWTFKTKTRSGEQQLTAPWMGFCNYIDDEYQRTLHNKNTDALKELLSEKECPNCAGSRLKERLLHTTFLGKNIHELTRMRIGESLELLEKVNEIEHPSERAIAQVVIASVRPMLQTLVDLGLGYLTLDRTIRSVSGGERQRILLAGQLASHLHGVTYILDEPTVGLDAKQVENLLEMLRAIIAKGNTVVVVEHDPSFIQQADYRIEMGPGAGKQGGEVVFEGPVKTILNRPSVVEEVAVDTLDEEDLHAEPSGELFGVKGAFYHNLKHIDVAFSAGQMIAVTGVSGSGKSTLIRDVLYASALKKRPVGCASYFGFDAFEMVILVDQEPLSANRLTTPASYIGLLDRLKMLFAKTPEAKAAGLKRADFGYQSKVGKCPACNGYGKQKTSLDFLSDVWSHCETCDGTRYSAAVNGILLDGQSIGSVLQLTVDEASTFLADKESQVLLKELQELGLGHLQLGQAGNTLSGGESQRLKLAKHLVTPSEGKRLFLLDEPGTGLHQLDILQLLRVFRTMISKGDTVLFIEHNQTMIAHADSVVHLGPGSGEDGGRLV